MATPYRKGKEAGLLIRFPTVGSRREGEAHSPGEANRLLRFQSWGFCLRRRAGMGRLDDIADWEPPKITCCPSVNWVGGKLPQ